MKLDGLEEMKYLFVRAEAEFFLQPVPGRLDASRTTVCEQSDVFGRHTELQKCAYSPVVGCKVGESAVELNKKSFMHLFKTGFKLLPGALVDIFFQVPDHGLQAFLSGFIQMLIDFFGCFNHFYPHLVLACQPKSLRSNHLL